MSSEQDPLCTSPNEESGPLAENTPLTGHEPNSPDDSQYRWTDKHRNTASKWVLEGGWVQKGSSTLVGQTKVSAKRTTSLYGSMRPRSGGGAFRHGHSVLGGRSLDRKMASRTKRSVDDTNSRSSDVETGERTCRGSDVRDP